MRTLNEYMPAMREQSAAWLYVSTRSLVGLCIAAVLLAVGVAGAMHYPTMQSDNALAKLTNFDQMIEVSHQATQTAINRLVALAVNQPKWQQDSTASMVASLQKEMALQKPTTAEEVFSDASKAQAKYQAAQQLVAASPFKGLTDNQIPVSAAGNAYREAVAMTPPPAFAYQQLDKGSLIALATYRSALATQTYAEQAAHDLDQRLNGGKASPLSADAKASASTDNGDIEGIAATPANEDRIIELLERKEAAQNARRAAPGNGDSASPAPSAPEMISPSSAPAATIDPTQQAQQAAQAKQRAAEIHARLQAQHAQQEAAQERTRQQQATLAAQQAELARQQAAQRAEQQKEQAALAAKQQAEADRQRMKQQCTSSIAARIACAAKGYNPLTGEKRGSGG